MIPAVVFLLFVSIGTDSQARLAGYELTSEKCSERLQVLVAGSPNITGGVCVPAKLGEVR